MKIAVMSDIHSNYIAFISTVKDALDQGVEKFIFLGDYVTDGYDADQILDTIKRLKAEAIIGNREKYIINYKEMDDSFNKRKNRVALGYESLSQESLDYINSLPSHKIIEIEGQRILLVHGDSFDNTSKPAHEVYEQAMEKFDFDACFMGHSHKYCDEQYKGKTFLNPGSVGQPLDTASYKYSIVNVQKGKEIEAEPRQIPVLSILNEVVSHYQKSGFTQDNPEWTNLILRTITDSKDYVGMFMPKLMKKVNASGDLTPEQFNAVFKMDYDLFCQENGLNQNIIVDKNIMKK